MMKMSSHFSHPPHQAVELEVVGPPQGGREHPCGGVQAQARVHLGWGQVERGEVACSPVTYPT